MGCCRLPEIVSMIRKYHNHKPQTTTWHREEEPLNHYETPGRQIKQSKQLSFPHQDDCNTRMGIMLVQQNIEQLHTPSMRVTINKKSSLNTPSPVRNMHFEGPQNMNQMRSPFMEKGEVCLSFLQKELNTIV